MKVGFIGLGTMGRPMALHLVRGGHELAVWARRPVSAEPLKSAGARVYASPAEVAQNAEVVFTVVTAAADTEAVVLGANGIVHGARAGTVVVDMATISPLATRRIAAALGERGVEMLDAPVSGGPMGAEQATLSIMVGGKPEVFARVKPLFECMGKTIMHMGDNGAGQVTKACNQLSLCVTAQGVAEALSLARRLGVDPAGVREVMAGGIAASRVLDVFGKRMVERDFEGGIETRLYHKDLDIVLGLVHEADLPAPAAALAMQQINAMMSAGDARRDLSGLVRVLERMAASDAPRQS
jgi:2-hydroxy-3-oxopropionate reductase